MILSITISVISLALLASAISPIVRKIKEAQRRSNW